MSLRDTKARRKFISIFLLPWEILQEKVYLNVHTSYLNNYVLLSRWLLLKNLPVNAGDIRDASSIPALGRSTGGGYGNPLQYSCLENPVDKIEINSFWLLDMHLSELILCDLYRYHSNSIMNLGKTNLIF